jgi:diguanylate cyclase (GGDEF)-like protein/PAS domain S-box-containing protein
MKTSSGLYKEVLDTLIEGVFFVDNDRRVTYWNRGAEQLTGYTAEDVVSQSCPDSFLLHIDEAGQHLCNDGCPLTRCLRSGQPAEAELYMQHREGHRVPVALKVTPILGDDGQVSGAVQTFRDNSGVVAMREQVARLQRSALFDPLTRLGNRRYVEQNLQARQGELERFGWPFGVLMMDIDHFKRVNDTHGHLTGDRVLRMVARTMTGNLRPYDILGRWGGEEFLAVVGFASHEALVTIGERFRMLVERSTLKHKGGELKVTLSIGGTLARPDDSRQSLVERADRQMYRCKQRGRNRVRVD